jgi:hypothetical protein
MPVNHASITSVKCSGDLVLTRHALNFIFLGVLSVLVPTDAQSQYTHTVISTMAAPGAMCDALQHLVRLRSAVFDVVVHHHNNQHRVGSITQVGRGEADALATDDGDGLVFGAATVLRRLVWPGSVEMINLAELIPAMGLETLDQLQQVCVCVYVCARACV